MSPSERTPNKKNSKGTSNEESRNVNSTGRGQNEHGISAEDGGPSDQPVMPSLDPVCESEDEGMKDEPMDTDQEEHSLADMPILEAIVPEPGPVILNEDGNRSDKEAKVDENESPQVVPVGAKETSSKNQNGFEEHSPTLSTSSRSHQWSGTRQQEQATSNASASSEERPMPDRRQQRCVSPDICDKASQVYQFYLKSSRARLAKVRDGQLRNRIKEKKERNGATRDKNESNKRAFLSSNGEPQPGCSRWLHSENSSNGEPQPGCSRWLHREDSPEMVSGNSYLEYYRRTLQGYNDSEEEDSGEAEIDYNANWEPQPPSPLYQVDESSADGFERMDTTPPTIATPPTKDEETVNEGAMMADAPPSVMGIPSTMDEETGNGATMMEVGLPTMQITPSTMQEEITGAATNEQATAIEAVIDEGSMQKMQQESAKPATTEDTGPETREINAPVNAAKLEKDAVSTASNQEVDASNDNATTVGAITTSVQDLSLQNAEVNTGIPFSVIGDVFGENHDDSDLVEFSPSMDQNYIDEIETDTGRISEENGETNPVDDGLFTREIPSNIWTGTTKQAKKDSDGWSFEDYFRKH